DLLGFGQSTSIALDPRLLTMTVLLAGTGLVISGAGRDALLRGRERSAPPSFRIAADLAVIGIAAAALIPGLLHRPPRTEQATFRDRTNDGLFATAARSGGMLLTGGSLHLAQLRTRRPVLIDGGGL